MYIITTLFFHHGRNRRGSFDTRSCLYFILRFVQSFLSLLLYFLPAFVRVFTVFWVGRLCGAESRGAPSSSLRTGTWPSSPKASGSNEDELKMIKSSLLMYFLQLSTNKKKEEEVKNVYQSLTDKY